MTIALSTATPRMSGAMETLDTGFPSARVSLGMDDTSVTLHGWFLLCWRRKYQLAAKGTVQDLVFSPKSVVLRGSKVEVTLPTGCDNMFGLSGYITCVALSFRALSGLQSSPCSPP